MQKYHNALTRAFSPRINTCTCTFKSNSCIQRLSKSSYKSTMSNGYKKFVCGFDAPRNGRYLCVHAALLPASLEESTRMPMLSISIPVPLVMSQEFHTAIELFLVFSLHFAVVRWPAQKHIKLQISYPSLLNFKLAQFLSRSRTPWLANTLGIEPLR